jgi:hypothetical protein
MEIVIALLVLVAGVGLLLVPRVARRRRSPAPAARPARWNGAAARGVRARADRRSAAAAATPAAAYVAPADDDIWDDDLEWEDAPPEANAPPEAAPAAPVDPAPAPQPAPAEPAAPAGRTWGAAPAATLDTPPAAPATALHTPPAATRPLGATPATALHSPAATPRTALGATPAAPATPLGATPAVPATPHEATPATPSSRLPRRSLKAATAPPATLDDAEGEWITAVDVPPPRITRGAAAFGASSHPTVTTTNRGNFASRHPIVLVALYAAAGIALVVVGVSVISSGSFRSDGSPAGERTAEVKVKSSPVPTAVHTPVATPKPTTTPAPTPDPAALKAKRERAAWVRERRSGHDAEGRAVDKARQKARLAERRRNERKRRQTTPTSTPTPVRSSPAPQPQPRPQPRPQPPPCEFCIG